MLCLALKNLSMSTKPVAASFCATFLAQEMRHVYRQIAGLQSFEPLILTHKRRNADDFPFDEKRIVTLPRPATRELRRFWSRHISHRPWQYYRSEINRIEDVLRKHDATILHIWFGHIGMHLLPLLRSKTRSCPAVVSFHGADAGVGLQKTNHLEIARAVFDHADAVLVRSESLATELRQLGCPEDKIYLQRTGLPLDEWPLAESREDPEDGSWHLVQTCRLIEKKAIDVTLRAVALARETFPNLRLTVAGDGPLRGDLDVLTSDLDLNDAVRFTGFLDQVEMQKLYTSAHAFVHPSRVGTDGNREGVPNAMLEAMATGLPVIATEHGGIPDAVDDGVSGFLVGEDEVDALAQAMVKMFSDPTRRNEMGRAARDSVVERFEQKQQMAALEEVYRTVIGESSYG
jgi:colanic acid/amylovoran biosynthesis glycosyltransferase